MKNHSFVPAAANNGWPLFALLLALLAALPPGPPAWAAGGAHIVDDSEVVEPGTCQFDTWVTKFDDVVGGGYFNATNACTLKDLPKLQFGAQFQHLWGADFGDAQVFGPQAKVNFLPEDSGVGIGLVFNSGVALQTGLLETANLLVPVTIPLNDHVRFNFNLGWNYIRIAESPDAMFYGAQVEAKIGWEDVSLMLEVFGRQPGFTGTQMGVRWRPNDGPINFDLLAGSFFDTVNAKFFTVGVTLRY
ncbi:MAG: hypothetical protein HYZ40_07120 [Rhodospirillales bacterium]|nr:hypothetical protein [Rhodospirillales bacterium]